MIFALIQDFKVVKIQESEDPQEIMDWSMTHQNVLDVTGIQPVPKVGWEFDGKEIVNPNPPASSKKITRLAFRNRFTQAEKATMYYVAAQNNAQGYAFKSYLDDLAAATFVDLARPDTIASIQLLVTYTIITQARADIILNAPIQDLEVFTL